MKLNKDWLTHGLMDFEYKKYLLLAYLKEIQSFFDEKKLYPFLTELIFHYNNLIRLKENKSLLYENFPKQLSKADFEKLKLSYQHIVQDSDLMKVLEEIICFSIPRFEEGLNLGADIFEEVASHIVIEPIGIAPLVNDEGYLFICEAKSNSIHIFQYHIASFKLSDEQCKGIHTEYLRTMECNLVNTLEKIKVELIKTHKKFPNPATFAAFSKIQYPLNETLLPITKRKLMQQISQAA